MATSVYDTGCVLIIRARVCQDIEVPPESEITAMSRRGLSVPPIASARTRYTANWRWKAGTSGTGRQAPR